MTSPVDKKQIKINWNDRNYSCDMFVDPPGQCWEDFTHSVDELVMVIEGKLECRSSNEYVPNLIFVKRHLLIFFSSLN